MWRRCSYPHHHSRSCSSLKKLLQTYESTIESHAEFHSARIIALGDRRMARGRRGSERGNGENLSGWFRKVFAEKRAWLEGRSNEDVIALWEAQHPGQKFGSRERNACNNLKSVLRKKLRKRGRKAAEDGALVPAVRISRANLELLEERIDECMSMARTLDREGLEKVAKLLRAARNEVVWRQGQ